MRFLNCCKLCHYYAELKACFVSWRMRQKTLSWLFSYFKPGFVKTGTSFTTSDDENVLGALHPQNEMMLDGVPHRMKDRLQLYAMDDTKPTLRYLVRNEVTAEFTILDQSAFHVLFEKKD